MGSWRRGLWGVCKEVGRTEKGRGGTPPFGELVQKFKSSKVHLSLCFLLR